MCVLFFFKQKTAYEMRISDWSSDVCSSDLRRRTVAAAAGLQRPPRAAVRLLHAGHPDEHGGLHPGQSEPVRPGGARGAGRQPDRKSVVEGKTVSVGVDLGGRSNIKK